MEISTRDAYLFLNTDDEKTLNNKVLFIASGVEYVLKTNEVFKRNEYCLFQNIPDYRLKQKNLADEEMNLKSFISSLEKNMNTTKILSVKLVLTPKIYRITKIEIQDNCIKLISDS
jgi:hypothetical protein